jgi:hypothetical protein
MLNEHILRESFKDPFVAKTLLRSKSLGWIPFEAARNEVHKRIIWCVS